MRKLAGAAHDLAHHSKSTMSWLYPHLFEACRMGGTLEAHLDLLEPEPYPRDLPRLEPLRLAAAALQEWFRDLLARLGFDQSVVQSVSLHFHFRDNPYESPAVSATITAHTGRTYTEKVDFIRA
jgi:hypothetical protein